MPKKNEMRTKLTTPSISYFAVKLLKHKIERDKVLINVER